MANQELANAFRIAKSNNEKKLLIKRKNEAQKIKEQYIKEFQAKKQKQEEVKKKKLSKPYFKKSDGPSLRVNPFAGRGGGRRKMVRIPRL